MINMFNTYIDKKALKQVSSIFKTTFLSEGKIVKEFESELSKLGLSYPAAVNSGTSALHLALDLAGVTEGDEVITSPQTFVATALAILYQRAKPIFADINYEDGNIKPESITKKITKKTKAILVVHWAGYPCDIDQIAQIARRHNLIVIEDAAQALGALYKGEIIGSLSPFTCFSFQAIKHVTTGDGGVVACKEKKMFEKGLVKRWFGIDRQHSPPSPLGERVYNIKTIGYKYHLNDYAAALGLANLASFKIRLSRRRKIAATYKRYLSKISGIDLYNYRNDCESAYWLFGFHVKKRSSFIKAMTDREIVVSVVHQRIDRNSLFGGITKGLYGQELFDADQINIPIHDGLSDEDVDYVIRSIKRGW